VCQLINAAKEEGEEEPWNPFILIDQIKTHRKPEELNVKILVPPDEEEAQSDALETYKDAELSKDIS
jgi:hypothetical protein